ncbi:Mg/Co/Ni transporter MgtE [Bacillus pakistanensis]|uniref:Mg/Co/Ni transporter MgtE n=1 Tax=Rossellomorea pakistanensis TaxID=992288 RepID=A0ABS2NCK6_9BACI|nr:hypothetical protein [Bacillus pakistanensis]MBM7585576.1 Mg/Co/Ni transporter MgtE [Bacillus pakistanensis]
MHHNVEFIDRAAIHGAGLGVIFMSFFGLLWSVTGIMGLQGLGSTITLWITGLIIWTTTKRLLMPLLIK